MLFRDGKYFIKEQVLWFGDQPNVVWPEIGVSVFVRRVAAPTRCLHDTLDQEELAESALKKATDTLFIDP
ncbi:hypothetical protein [Haloarcula marina]|uniref:hypothetical protein n=1 Tax=Haloarcula marina TaxID=2961574 RepID=UPI0020B8B359|nr:hypothetical protein [Halomicroarcula marina]